MVLKKKLEKYFNKLSHAHCQLRFHQFFKNLCLLFRPVSFVLFASFIYLKVNLNLNSLETVFTLLSSKEYLGYFLAYGSFYLLLVAYDFWVIKVLNTLKIDLTSRLFIDFSLKTANLSYSSSLKSKGVTKSQSLAEVIMKCYGLTDAFYRPSASSILSVVWSLVGLFFLVVFLLNPHLIPSVESILKVLPFFLSFNLALYTFQRWYLKTLEGTQKLLSLNQMQALKQWFMYQIFYDECLAKNRLTYLLNLKKYINDLIFSRCTEFYATQLKRVDASIKKDQVRFIFAFAIQGPVFEFFVSFLCYNIFNLSFVVIITLVPLLVYSWLTIIDTKRSEEDLALNLVRVDAILQENIPDYEGQEQEEETISEPKKLETSGLNVTNLDYETSKIFKLKNLSFKIEPKEKVAIIGDTGSGKSTLLSLMAGYPQFNPAITLENGNTDLKSNVLWVSQEPEFYAGTLRQNASCGYQYDPLLLKKVNLELDPDLELYRDGIALSGGEKQRIALIRTYHLLRNQKQPIVLLDQSFSAIDPVLKVKLIRQFLKDFSEKTLVFVIHDYLYLNLFDKIMYIKQGEIMFIGGFKQFKQTNYYTEYLEVVNQPKKKE